VTTKPRFQDDQRGYLLPCPACGSKPGEKCTEATDDGQKYVAYQHLARTDQLAKEDE
jgi:hypothetical protein